MEGIIQLFIQWFPYSLIVLAIPIVLFFTRSSEKSTQIKNQVEVFFKGNTKGYYPCTVEKDRIKFTIDETDYEEPITHFPRLETRKNQLYRVYLFAEAVGMIDVPPLTVEDKEKIIKYLKDNNAIQDATLKAKDAKDWTESELMVYVQFYHFDIEQILDKPMQNAFKSGTGAIIAILDRIAERNRQLEGAGKTSNMVKLAIFVGGVLVGAGWMWAFALKGYV